MERLLQYWDDVDDLVGALLLTGERLRRLLLFTLTALAYAGTVFAGVTLAIAEPPLAMAAATLLGVGLMYRSVTGPRPVRAGT